MRPSLQGGARKRSLVEAPRSRSSVTSRFSAQRFTDSLQHTTREPFTWALWRRIQRNRLRKRVNEGPERQRAAELLHHEDRPRRFSTTGRSHVAVRLVPRPLAATHRTPTIRSRRSIPGASSWGSLSLGGSRGELSCSAVSRFIEGSNESKRVHGGATVDPRGAAKAFMVSHHHGQGEEWSTGPSFMPEESEARMECIFRLLSLLFPHR